jgi:hypothetical protein
MKILDTIIEPMENITFSFRHYRLWWLTLLITIFFDYITTLSFVTKFGANAEANYIIRWLILNIGLYYGLLIGKLLQLLSVFVFISLHQRLGGIFLLLVVILNCWAIVMNSMPFA